MTLDLQGSRGFLRMDACHEKTKLFRRGFLAWHNIHDLAFIHDRDPVRESQDFIEVFGDQHDRHPLPPLFEQLFAHVFHCADVETAGGLSRQDNARAAREFACEHYFLDIASRKILCQRIS